MPKGSRTEIKPGVHRLRVDAGPNPATGKRRQISKVIHGGKREAISALRRLNNEVESGAATNAKQTVGELMQDWLEFKRGKLSPKSIELYSSCMRLHILPALGRRKLTSLTPHDLDKFYGALNKIGVSAYGVRQVHATLRAALSQGVKWQMVANNAALLATPPQIPKKAPRSITPEQLASIIAKATKDCDASLVRFFMLAALTGARRVNHHGKTFFAWSFASLEANDGCPGTLVLPHPLFSWGQVGTDISPDRDSLSLVVA